MSSRALEAREFNKNIKKSYLTFSSFLCIKINKLHNLRREQG
jgi:hypothetical protein